MEFWLACYVSQELTTGSMGSHFSLHSKGLAGMPAGAEAAPKPSRSSWKAGGGAG